MTFMKIELDASKTANENAQAQFQKAKEAKEKKANLENEISEKKKQLQEEEKSQKSLSKEEKEIQKKRIRILEHKEWYQKFQSFHTSEGKIVIAGRDAQQNDQLFSKHLEEGDLFFHADVHGASAVILKKGTQANEQSLKEAAQFSVIYSSAWKGMLKVANTYYVDKDHVEKYSHGEYVPKGGFMIRGEKKYFKNTELKLIIGIERINNVEKLTYLPASFDLMHSPRHVLRKVILQPGETEKKQMASQIVKKLGAEEIELAEEQIIQMLPGNCEFA